MQLYFSRRHADVLESGKMKVLLPRQLRVSIRRILDRHSIYEPPDATHEGPRNTTFLEAERELKDFYGEDWLVAHDSECNLVPVNFATFIDRAKPANVFDALEAWMACVPEERAIRCEREINQAFEVHQSPWRIVNGMILRVDSEYVHRGIISKAQILMKEARFSGPLEEFQTAVSLLMSERPKDAAASALKSVESTMKAALGTRDRLTFTELLHRLIKSGIIPKYHGEFHTHFEKLALGVAQVRNRPGSGHGQGKDILEMPRSLAEFTVNLAAVINIFIIKSWLEQRPCKQDGPKESA